MALYKKVVKTVEIKTFIKDANGNDVELVRKVPIEEEVQLSVEEEAAQLAEWAANDIEQAKIDYIQKRQAEYPPLEKQLEILCEEGLEALKQRIQAVKAKYPKPS
jgi:hypothetical protein